MRMKSIIIDDDKMSRDILAKFIENFSDLDLIEQFENPVEAMSYLNKNDVDLIFLDIEMPQMTGMQFIELLNEKLPQVILTSSHEQFAIDAFKYNVTGYLLKPLDYNEFCKAVLKAQNNHKKEGTLVQKNDNILFVKYGNSIEKLNKSDLIMIECLGDYANLITKEKKTYTVHATMKSLEKKFSEADFMRVHRSYIVRIDAIEKIEDDAIIFGRKTVPIGKTYKQQVYQKLNML